VIDKFNNCFPTK